MKIYTKTGDQGTTALFGGKRVHKDDIRVEAYGTVDELNAMVGLLYSKLQEPELLSELDAIQNELFVIGSHLASDPARPGLKLPAFKNESILDLERSIDLMDEKLNPLKYFILPRGSESISLAHLCRTICRRAERRVVSLGKIESLDSDIMVYLNRLSDYFFTLSRFIAKNDKVDEIPWKD